MTKSIEIFQGSFTPEVCGCTCCQQLLNLQPTGKVEIWYGTGSNGKTTLLHALGERFGMENVLVISPEWPFSQWLSKVKDTTKLICVQELAEGDEEFVNQIMQHIKPNIRYITTTNVIYPWMEQSRNCRITSFPHRFVAADHTK